MLITNIFVIIFGLASAFSWGAGDFSGGLSSKGTSPYSVVAISQFVSLLVLFLGALLVPEGTSTNFDVLIGGIAGVFGAAGLVALYSGLARGPMGLVAPISAVVAAVLPVLVSVVNEGLPENTVIVGFVIALSAVWLISRGEMDSRLKLNDLRLPIVAGLGFGIFFVLIDQVSSNAILLPLVSARSTSIIFILSVGFLAKEIEMPKLHQFPLITFAGILDTSGNVFFALATRFGRLDISAILGSLYPAVTVLLAWIILKERLTFQQTWGIVLAIVALILIAI